MKKDEQGRLVFKKGFFIKYLWGTNSVPSVMTLIIEGSVKTVKPDYPKSICTLFWGSLLSPFVWWASLVIAPFLVCIILVIYTVPFLCGFLPVLSRKKYHRREDLKKEVIWLHPHRRYGNNDEKKIPIAPWQIILPLFLAWLIIEDNFAVPKAIYLAITSYITWIVIGAIALIGSLILFFRSTAGKVTVEFIKAKKRKVCPLITFEEKEKT